MVRGEMLFWIKMRSARNLKYAGFSGIPVKFQGSPQVSSGFFCVLSSRCIAVSSKNRVSESNEHLLLRQRYNIFYLWTDYNMIYLTVAILVGVCFTVCILIYLYAMKGTSMCAVFLVFVGYSLGFAVLVLIPYDIALVLFI